MTNDTDINKTVVSNKLPFGKEDLKYFIGYKHSEKNRSIYLFRPPMIKYKWTFDENRHIYFLMKEEKVFIKYMEILEKVKNISKTNLIVNLYIVRNI